MNTNTLSIDELKLKKLLVVRNTPLPASVECCECLQAYLVNGSYGYTITKQQCTMPFVHVVYIGNGMVWLRTKENILTMKLGKFLGKFTNNTNMKVKMLVELQKKFECSTVDYTVVISKNAERIVEVYDTPLYADGSYQQSCMTGYDCVKVYADNEALSLFIVYNKDNEVVARTLVRDDNTHAGYVRIYTNRNKISTSILYKLLDQNGYVAETDLGGCQLQLIYDDNNNIVCPYIDGSCKSIHVYDDYLVVGSYGGVAGDSTAGYITIGVVCEDCTERFNEDDLVYVESCDVHICNDCFEQSYVYFGDVAYHTDNITYLNVDIRFEGQSYDYIPNDCIR